MSQRNRALAALGAVVVLVIAFILLRPGDDNTDNNTEPAATVAATTTTTPSVSASTTSTTTTPAPAAKPRPQVTTVRAVGLKPVGGIQSIKVSKGDTVRFTVTSDQPENVHLHGYDVEKPVSPGKPARYAFKANIEGIFEVELEESGVQLIKLQVDP